MAQYKQREYVTLTYSTAFDVRYAAGTTAQNPGIYRCPACGEEIAVVKGHRLPPQNHHEHKGVEGKVEWQLLVYAEQSK